MVEVTYRTVQGRFLLRPGRALNEILLGVLARALALHPTVKLIGFVALSNHVHMALWVENQFQLSRIMHYFGTHSARKINQLRDREGSLWHRRYTGICVTAEPEAQIRRLAYLLAQGVKENLVAQIAHWPGIHFGKALLEGRSLLVGKWVSGTKKYRGSLRRNQPRPEDYTTIETVELAPPPCWSHLGWGEYVERIRELAAEIENQAATERRRDGREVLGAEAILRCDPEDRPEEVPSSPAPLVHAATRKVRQAWVAAYSWFLDQYRAAAERLKKGDLAAPFPEGCFPPPLPFVGAGAGGVPRSESPA